MPCQCDEVDSASVAYFAEPSLAPIVVYRRQIISVADVSQGMCGHGGFRLGAVIHILGLRVGVRMRSGSVALGLLDDSKWMISVFFLLQWFRPDAASPHAFFSLFCGKDVSLDGPVIFGYLAHIYRRLDAVCGRESV